MPVTEEESAIVAALEAAGYRKIQDLTIFASAHTSKELQSAVPVAVEWLAKARSPGNRTALAWMLAGPHGRPAIGALLNAFRQEPNVWTREAIGHALADVAGKPVQHAFADLVAIFEDADGYDLRARFPILEAIGRLGSQDGLSYTRRYLKDPDFAWDALEGFTGGGGVLTRPEIDELAEVWRGEAGIEKWLSIQRRREARASGQAAGVRLKPDR